MIPSPSYCVILVPTQEVVARSCSLAEAGAYALTYNTIMLGERTQAMIAEEEGEEERGRAVRHWHCEMSQREMSQREMPRGEPQGESVFRGSLRGATPNAGRRG